jgi:hypothetical protein
MKKTPYQGSVVAYVDRADHQYGHTVQLDGKQAWIDEHGALWLDFGDAIPKVFGDGNILFPAQWNFVSDEDIMPNCVYPRDDLPTLEDNVSPEVLAKIVSGFQEVG